MFHIENGIKLTRPGLAIDFRRRQRRAFISHAHFDHMARHELALCTPATAQFYQHRLGSRPVLELPFYRRIDFGGVRLSAWPAGHCLGSAMLLAEDADERLLYTGDFKLRLSSTAEPAEFPAAETLIMECTFGRPQFRLPPRAQIVEALVQLVREILDQKKTPVLHLYPLGKSQEVTRILTDHGISVLQHPEVFAISRLYEACGVPLGCYREFAAPPRRGWAVITLPKSSPRFRLPGILRPVSIALTGWALERGAALRMGVDHAIPLSDHAGFDELLEAVKLVGPRKVYCTHGPVEFVDHLHRNGWDAEPLAWSSIRARA